MQNGSGGFKLLQTEFKPVSSTQAPHSSMCPSTFTDQKPTTPNILFEPSLHEALRTV